jgi:hypothetical protein
MIELIVSTEALEHVYDRIDRASVGSDRRDLVRPTGR